MIIAIDFDGTICKHVYPQVGDPNPHALEVIHRIQAAGHQIILWTMRSGQSLGDACDYLWKNGVTLFGINENPEQHVWTTSPKCFAHLYIDDAAAFCPLVEPENERAYVDWFIVEKWLEDRQVI